MHSLTFVVTIGFTHAQEGGGGAQPVHASTPICIYLYVTPLEQKTNTLCLFFHFLACIICTASVGIRHIIELVDSMHVCKKGWPTHSHMCNALKKLTQNKNKMDTTLATETDTPPN